MNKKSTSYKGSELRAGLLEFRREFLTIGALSLVVNVLMLSPTLFQLQITDRIFMSKSVSSLLSMSLIIVFFFLVMAVSEWIRSMLLVRAGLRFDQYFGSRVFRASFDAQLRAKSRDPSEAIADLTNIRQFLTGNGIFAFFDAPWTPIYIIVVWMMNPILGVASLGFVLLMVVQALWTNRMTDAASERAMQMGRETSVDISSKLRNAEAVEAMGLVPNLRAIWLARHKSDLAANLEVEHLGHKSLAVSKLMRHVQGAAILALGAILVIDGKLTAGQMIAVNVLMQRALQPVDMIVSSWRSFVYSYKSFSRLEALLQRNPLVVPTGPYAKVTGQVSVSDLRVEVDGRTQPILLVKDCQFYPGTVTAILGPSGSGKSTFAKVILGIWPSMEGRVLVDGTPVGSWDRQVLGESVGYLPQDIELLEGSIAENIGRFGAPDSELVIQAAKRAGVHEMILRFPRGYDTLLGEAVGILSAGQKQRIALARAIYADPVLLVLDEPNSNLDDVGEAALISVINEMKRGGANVVVITHRPGILAAVDRFIVLSAGRVEQDFSREQIVEIQSTAAALATTTT